MTYRALIIDDDPGICEAVREVVTALGHHVEQAHDREGALALLRNERYAYVILDLEIPNRPGGFARRLYGERLLEEIRRVPGHVNTPVIVMTAHGSNGPELAVSLMRRGARNFVNKPLDDDRLERAIQDVLNHADPASEQDRLRAVVTAPRDWLTVTQAAQLLMEVVSGLSVAKAKARVSRAASTSGKFKTNGGCGPARRIERDSFNSWLLAERERDLAAADGPH